MDFTRTNDRLGSTTPIYSRIVSLTHPTRELKYEYLRKDLKNCSADHLASRLLEEIQEHDKLKVTVQRLESRNSQIQSELAIVVESLETRNTDQLKLAVIQEKNSEKIKRLERDLESKAATANSYWENRYQQLNRYLTIYTQEITQMQEEFRSQYSNLSQQLERSEKLLQEQMHLRENLATRLTVQRQQLEQTDETNARLSEEKKDLESALAQLENENGRLMQSSRNYSEELQRCTELTDKLFTEVREKGLELKQKNETIGYLEKHLNESVDEIERLNELLRSSIDSDNKAFQQIQRLDLKVSQSKQNLESNRAEIQERNSRISSLETEVKSMLQTNDVLKQLARDLQLKLVTSLANEQHLKSLSDQKHERIMQLERRCSELQKQVKRLEAELEENAAMYRRELQGNMLIIQELEKYKKQGTRKNSVLNSLKERNSQPQAKEFRLNDFQQKLDRYSASKSGLEADDTGNQLSFTRSKTGRDTSPDGLRRIVDEISQKVNQLTEAQASASLRHSRQQDRMYQRNQDTEQEQQVNIEREQP